MIASFRSASHSREWTENLDRARRTARFFVTNKLPKRKR